MRETLGLLQEELGKIQCLLAETTERHVINRLPELKQRVEWLQDEIAQLTHLQHQLSIQKAVQSEYFVVLGAGE